MSHLTQSMVEQFFELEKESARGVLRKEMDSAMDTIFKQMKRKLMMLVESGTEIGHGLTHLDVTIDGGHQLYESLNDYNPIPSATTNSHGHFSVFNLFEQGGSGDHHEQQLYSYSNQINSTSTNSYVPDNVPQQDDEITVKNELGEIVNIIPNESIPSSSSQSQSIEQSNNNIYDFLDDEEEDCDCPECVGNLLVKNEEGDEEDDDVQLIEDDESSHSNSRPTKRLRLDIDHTQPNNQTTQNQIITISLKCPQCSLMFPSRYALNPHLRSVHSIEQFRCLFKDCSQSFKAKKLLSHHYQATHLKSQPNTMWPCGYCSGSFKNSNSLFTHHFNVHEEGLFRCAHPNCQFVAELKQTVANHFAHSHKSIVCPYPDCAKRFNKPSQLKSHQRMHLNVRPYRCKWPQCLYAGSAYKNKTINHIRNHLKILTSHGVDPNDYLEVMNELL